MKNSHFKKLLGIVQIVVLALIISATASFVIAGSYSEPISSPPGGNVEPPINTSRTGQIKNGGVTLNLLGTDASNGLIVAHGNVGIGNTTPAEKLDISGNAKATAFFYASDRSQKKNISPLSDSLQKISALQGVSFVWRQDGKPSLGLIAQDVEKVYPELVATDPTTGLKSLQYANLVAPLIEAVKAQQKEIDQLKAEIAELKGKK